MADRELSQNGKSRRLRLIARQAEAVEPCDIVRTAEAGHVMANLHDTVHLVVYYMTRLPKVYGIYDFVVTVVLVPVEIRRLPAMTGVMEEERIVRSRVFHQPVHCSQDICLGRLAHRILLIICQDHHVLSLVAEMAVQVGRHILHIVDASSELASLAKVVDTYEKRFPSAGAVGVLECIPAGCAGAESLGLRGWRRRSTVACR